MLREVTEGARDVQVPGVGLNVCGEELNSFEREVKHIFRKSTGPFEIGIGTRNRNVRNS